METILSVVITDTSGSLHLMKLLYNAKNAMKIQDFMLLHVLMEFFTNVYINLTPILHCYFQVILYLLQDHLVNIVHIMQLLATGHMFLSASLVFMLTIKNNNASSALPTVSAEACSTLRVLQPTRSSRQPAATAKSRSALIVISVWKIWSIALNVRVTLRSSQSPALRKEFCLAAFLKTMSRVSQ